MRNNNNTENSSYLDTDTVNNETTEFNLGNTGKLGGPGKLIVNQIVAARIKDVRHTIRQCKR